MVQHFSLFDRNGRHKLKMSARLINGADVILVFRVLNVRTAQQQRGSRGTDKCVHLTALNAFRLVMNVYLPQGSRQVR